jgi:hypothetical protein
MLSARSTGRIIIDVLFVWFEPLNKVRLIALYRSVKIGSLAALI